MPDESGESRDDLPVEPTAEAPYSEWISEVRRLYVEPKGSSELHFVVEDEPEDSEPVKGRGRGRLLGRGRRQQATATPPAGSPEVPARPSLADLIAAPSVTPRAAGVAPVSAEPEAVVEPVVLDEPELPRVVAEEPVVLEEPETAHDVVAEPELAESTEVVAAQVVVEEPLVLDEPAVPDEPAVAPDAHTAVDLTDDPSWLAGSVAEPKTADDVAFEAWPAEPFVATVSGVDEEPAFEAWPVVAAGEPASRDPEDTSARGAGRHEVEDETAATTDAASDIDTQIDAELVEEPVRRRSWWDEGDIGDDIDSADSADSAAAQFSPDGSDVDPTPTVGRGEASEGDVAPVARRSDRHRPSGRSAGRSSRQPAPAPLVPATDGDEAPSFEAALLAAEAEEAGRTSGSAAPATRAESRAAARLTEKQRTTRRRRALVAAIVLLIVVAATWWVLRPHQTASADTTTAQDAAAVLVVTQHTTAFRS